MNRHPNRFVIKIKLDFVLSLLKCDFLMWVFFGTIKTIYILTLTIWIKQQWIHINFSKRHYQGVLSIFKVKLILTLRHWNFLSYTKRLRNSMFKIFGLSIMRLILQVKHGCTLLSYYLRTFVIRIDFKMSPVLLTFLYLWHKKVWWTPPIFDMLLMIHYLTQWITYTIGQSTQQLKITAILTHSLKRTNQLKGTQTNQNKQKTETVKENPRRNNL